MVFIEGEEEGPGNNSAIYRLVEPSPQLQPLKEI